MNFFDMLMNDPVVIYSFGGLAILLGIGAFYIYYFIKNVNENNWLTGGMKITSSPLTLTA